MKRVQCILGGSSRIWVNESETKQITGPQYLEVVTVVNEITSEGCQCYHLLEYPTTNDDGFNVICFKELASDEELEAYRDKVEQLQFKEITALELVYTKVEV